jgi:hypothetical protein
MARHLVIHPAYRRREVSNASPVPLPSIPVTREWGKEVSMCDYRYPLSPRIRTLKEIRAKIRPEPVREPLLTAGRFEPPSMTRNKRR